MGDDEVEVDVKLFITCRMCLDEHGVYQIGPSVMNLIKYCFDIDVEPFDGLPQLICKKCKSIVIESHETKSMFLKKQQQLREKLKRPNNKKPLPEAKSNITKEGGKSSNSPIVQPKDVASRYGTEQTTDTWKKAYNNYYVCKICSKRFQNLSSVKKHINTHKSILKKHKKVFRHYCVVQLNKIDNKPNSTGCSNVVVYDKNKVILAKGNSRFHSFCLRKGTSGYPESEEDINVISTGKRRAVSSDSKDFCKGKKKRKSRRLFSSSSSQTTILDDSKADCSAYNNIAEHNTLNNFNSSDRAECINIDDTSSECATKNKLDLDKQNALRQQNAPKATIANYKAIQSIVAMCHKQYKKKIESENETINKPSEDNLKHKVLSLGRKVINKQGFGCTGLLRYMEYKDLEVTWHSATHTIRNKGSNFVRIMPKKKLRQNSENNEIGWKNLHEISFLTSQVVSDNVDESDGLNVAVVPTMKTIEEETSCPLDIPKEDQSDQVSSNGTNDLYYKNKLLNKSPVANPKQLPKKNGLIENKPIPNDSTMLPTIEVGGQIAKEDVEDNNFGLPIITSTISLSKTFDNDTEADQPVTDIPAPRIKVKPASELMTERALSSQVASADIWATNKRFISVPLTSSMVYVTSPISQANYQPVNHLVSIIADPPPHGGDRSLIDETNLNDDNNTNFEFVTLNSLELPNTKTKSPFQYFKTVLIHHGLILMDINEELPSHFICLVKFKLLLKQDTKQPLGVVLSLFCSSNNFCFNFKDSKLKNFDPTQLPAFWQWELLKVYKGDVVNKILQNAMKISKEVYEHTKNFLCLLKSINLIT